MQKLLELKNFIDSLGGISSAVNRLWGIELDKKAEEELKKVMEIVKLRMQTNSLKKIAKLTKMSKNTVEKWIYEINLLFIIRYLICVPKIKIKKNHQLLSLNYSRSSLPLGPWIEVPNEIKNLKSIMDVINQIKPINSDNIGRFNIKTDDIKILRLNLFAYLLGMIVGDTSKPGVKTKSGTTRRIQLRLTKRYKSNKRLGEFTCLCMNNIGLRMSRYKDCPQGKMNTYPFYAWCSQHSHLIDWIFKICLGLDNDEKTTYDPINAKWILKTPKEFRIWFLQGLADSDGYVDIKCYQAGIITGPNHELVQQILTSLSIHSNKGFLHKGTLSVIRINLRDAKKLPLFNPYVKLYRYCLMEKITKAKRYSWHWPEWLGKKVDKYIKKGMTSTQIMHTILEEYDVSVGQGGVWKRMKKFKNNNKKLLALGVESTALE